MSYHHLSTYERGCIEAFHQIGYSNRKIATLLKRHRSCIDREIKRNTTGTTYRAETAEQNYHIRRLHSRWDGKWCTNVSDTIKEKLLETWSPEQIANTVLLGKVTFKTIYRWLYSGKLSGVNLTALRQKGRRKKHPETRGKFTVGAPISQRPAEVKNREVFGHWELDTMVSSRGESKGCFATFVERKSRLYTALKIPDRMATSMEKAIAYIHKLLPAGAFKTATTDRGKEFACFPTVQDKLNLTLYFADAYSSWQRGSNENSNGLLREFYPKKTNLANVKQHELSRVLFLINNRPRKCLGWHSSIQVFLHELALLP